MNDPYSRVTNAERFAPLVQFTVDLCSRLEIRYDVERSEKFTASAAVGMQTFVPLRAPICLTPRASNAAAIMVGFTQFPGLAVRCGYWHSEAFPSCGCDGCAETAEDECKRVAELVDAVTAGRFYEMIVLPFIGSAHVRWESSSDFHHRGNGRAIRRSQARELLRGRPRAAAWGPWSVRPGLGAKHDI